MATQISDGSSVPHATDYADLLSKLVTFATANGWSVEENTSDKTVLKGEGLAGTDEIYVAIQKYSDVLNDSYGWHLNGYTGYQSGYGFLEQPGAIRTNEIGGRGWLSTPLWSGTIPYWFIVSARRIIVVAKISTTYQWAYLGFFLPFSSPHQYPYPLCVGASSTTVPAEPCPRWSKTTSDSAAFWSGLPSTSSTPSCTMYTRLANGAWYAGANQYLLDYIVQLRGMFPYNQADVDNMRQSLTDEAVLTAIEIQEAQLSGTTSVNRLGELDGIYHISGHSRAAEDVITVGSDDYIVFPNIYRSGIADYAAVKMV